MDNSKEVEETVERPEEEVEQKEEEPVEKQEEQAEETPEQREEAPEQREDNTVPYDHPSPVINVKTFNPELTNTEEKETDKSAMLLENKSQLSFREGEQGKPDDLGPIEEKSESVNESEVASSRKEAKPQENSVNALEKSTIEKLKNIDPKKALKQPGKSPKVEKKTFEPDVNSEFDRMSTIKRRVETDSEYNVELKGQNDFINMSRFDEASRIGFTTAPAEEGQEGQDELEKVNFDSVKPQNTESSAKKESEEKIKYEARELEKCLNKQKIRKSDFKQTVRQICTPSNRKQSKGREAFREHCIRFEERKRRIKAGTQA